MQVTDKELEWFRERGLWKTTQDPGYVILKQLTSHQLDNLARCPEIYNYQGYDSKPK